MKKKKKITLNYVTSLRNTKYFQRFSVKVTFVNYA